MTSSKLKIFIADDNQTFRKIVKNYLENTGEFILVGEASDGLECIRKTDELQIDILLMDITMPNMDGIQASKLINQKFPYSPKIIALSQHAEFEYAKSMIEAGAKGYIVKSEVGKQLIAAIKKVINGKFYFPSLIL